MLSTYWRFHNMFHDLNPYQLAGMADCASPDSLTSAGAMFLRHVADAVSEALEWPMDDAGATLAEAVDIVRADGVHEIADAAPDVYTYTRWQEFVDLAAWQEDIDEHGGSFDDLTQAAGMALYIIAERLVIELLDIAEGEG